jgi:hypothetical protein
VDVMMIALLKSRWTRVTWAAACLAIGECALISLSETPAIADDDVQSNRIRVEYAQPKSLEIAPYYQMVMQRNALERVQEVFSPLMLPSDITVRTTECGVSNAWYQRPTVTICYEYLRDLIDMAPKEPSRDGITPADAVVGQFLFTAAHEMGHAVFDLLDVPIFGRPEDAADQFAIYILLRIGKQDARKLVECCVSVTGLIPRRLPLWWTICQKRVCPVARPNTARSISRSRSSLSRTLIKI